MVSLQGPDGETITFRPDEHPTIVDTWKDMEKLLASGKFFFTPRPIPRMI